MADRWSCTLSVFCDLDPGHCEGFGKLQRRLGDFLPNPTDCIWTQDHQNHPFYSDIIDLFTDLPTHWQWIGADGLLLLLECGFFGYCRDIPLVGINAKNVPLASQFAQGPHLFGGIGNLFYVQIRKSCRKISKNLRDIFNPSTLPIFTIKLFFRSLQVCQPFMCLFQLLNEKVWRKFI